MATERRRRPDAEPLSTTEGRERSAASEEDVRDRAYQIFEERGSGHGHDVDDWLRAEKELRKER
jgi:hypothetical protein